MKPSIRYYYSREYQSLIKEAWHQFINDEPFDKNIVPEHVLLGWTISKNSGVDPLAHRVPPVLSNKEIKALRQKHLALVEAAEPILEMLDISIRDTSYVANLVVAPGYALAVIGTGSLLKTAVKQHNIVGAHTSVEFIGATARMLSILTGKPARLIGCEHFNLHEQEWQCFSAPIFNELREPIGSLTLSSHITSEYTNTTLLAESCANCISISIRENALMQEQKRLSAMLGLVHDSLPEPILAIQPNGKITHANNKAREHVVGCETSIADLKINHLFEKEDLPKVIQILRQGTPETVELRMLTHKGKQSFICQFEPIFVDNKKPGGATLSIRLEDKLITLANRVGGNYAAFTFDSIKCKSLGMRRQIEFAKRAAQSDSRVLLFGESGTGKELFAQSIHNASSNHAGPFVAVSCAAIPRDLIESELFGYVDGAFTGAKKGGMVGKFELANGGTLFLDEINSLPLDMQSKLLRALQQMEVVRLGGSRPTPLSVRVICATNRKLVEAVQQGTFREDLYFRINVVEIEIPPLRERIEDIELLANIFIRRQAAKMNRAAPHISAGALDIMVRYGWPGNVRELENICERALLLATSDVINPEHLHLKLLQHSIPTMSVQENIIRIDRPARVDDTYRSLIYSALSDNGGNLTAAAKQLGVARATLYRRMRTLGISHVKG